MHRLGEIKRKLLEIKPQQLNVHLFKREVVSLWSSWTTATLQGGAGDEAIGGAIAVAMDGEAVSIDGEARAASGGTAAVLALDPDIQIKGATARLSLKIYQVCM